MTIKEELKKLIKAKGGSVSGVHVISDAVSKLTDVENAANPLSALTVDVTVGASTDLLGKYIGDLQKDVVIGANKITGELYYVDDYTGFSGVEEEQQGWYLVTHATVPDVTGATIRIGISTKEGTKVLDPSDGILIQRLTPTHLGLGAVLSFIASKDGYPDFVRSYDLTGLKLGGEKPDEETEIPSDGK